MPSEPPNTTASDRETARLEAKANLLLALYSHASDELERTRAEADDLRGRWAEAENLRRQLRAELEQAREELERVHRKLGEARHECDRLTERASQLDKRHQAVLNSTSWRMTAPIRALAGVMKR